MSRKSELRREIENFWATYKEGDPTDVIDKLQMQLISAIITSNPMLCDQRLTQLRKETEQ